MDLALTNARIYTSDAQCPWADTVVIKDGRFTFVGDHADAPRDDLIAERDLKGAFVLPGLIDSHTHPAAVARSSWHIRLPWTDDVDELLAFIGEYARAHPPSEAPFLYFEYYPSTLFADASPSKELLDSVVSDRPVLCQDFSEHACWVNSRMLELMGVTADTADPVPGLEMFGRDEDGNPTGHLFEGVWRHFVDVMYDKLGWRPPDSIDVDTLEPVLAFFRRHGVTALFDAVLEDEDVLRTLAELDSRDELHLRYQGAPRFRSLAELPDTLALVHRYQQQYGSERVRIQAVKLFLDGTNESGNSAVLEPLIHDGGAHDAGAHDHGSITMDTDELTECVVLCNDAAVDLHIHMVGDRAFRTGCDAVEAARGRVAGSGQQWRTQVTFAHCELVDPADMARPEQLGIVINWTAHWSAGYFGEESKHYLGEDRWNRMYAFNDIADSGATLTFSSDVVTQYELNRGNPFFGMQVASTRIDPQYPLDPQRYERSVRPSTSSVLSRELLVKGYTISGARQLRIDDQVGSIEVGKLADLIVLDDDLFAVEADQLQHLRPTAVLSAGSVVYGNL